MQDAIIAIEDARFRDHGGVDPIGLVRAAVSDYLGNGSEVQGASTLTQQYIKNLFLEQAAYKGDKAAPGGRDGADASRKILEIRGGDRPREEAHQGPDPRGLPEHRLLRQRRVRHRGGRGALLQHARAAKLTVEQSAHARGHRAVARSRTTRSGNKTTAMNRRNVVLDRMHELKLITDAPWTKAKASKIVLKRKLPQVRAASAPRRASASSASTCAS